MNKKIANLVFNSFINDSRVLKESRSLANYGYQVHVLAHLDKNLVSFEKKDDFCIRRFSYLDRSVTRCKIVKLKAYLEYAKECINYCKDFDIVHCNDLNTLPIGFIVKKFFNKNVKIVYDAHEYETEVNGLKGLQKTVTQKLEKYLIKYADKVITVSDAIANEYVKNYNIKKPALVLNTPPYTEMEKRDIFRGALNIPKDKTIFLYQGGLSKGRGIEILLEAFQNISDKRSVIVFMGYGPLQNLVEKSAEEYDNIYFHKAVEPGVLLEYTSSADFGILFYENSCLNHYYCSPNKMFEYIMAEIPVIVSNLYEMKRLVQENKIGIVAKDNTSKGLQKAIEEALLLDQNKLRKNIQKVKKLYNWEKQEKVLVDVYKSLDNE